MKSLFKRCLVVGLSMSIVFLTGLRNWAESDLEGSVEDDQPGTKVPRQLGAGLKPVEGNLHAFPLATTVTFTGTVVRNGSRFVLRETAGVLYTLDSIARAWAFEGEDVRVTGKVDSATHLLHVDDIERLVA